MTTANSIEIGSYVLADLIGFAGNGAPTEMRCRVTRVDVPSDTVFIMTADIRDAGTRIPVNASKVRPMPAAPTTYRHRDGLVSFAV